MRSVLSTTSTDANHNAVSTEDAASANSDDCFADLDEAARVAADCGNIHLE